VRRSSTTSNLDRRRVWGAHDSILQHGHRKGPRRQDAIRVRARRRIAPRLGPQGHQGHRLRLRRVPRGSGRRGIAKLCRLTCTYRTEAEGDALRGTRGTPRPRRHRARGGVVAHHARRPRRHLVGRLATRRPPRRSGRRRPGQGRRGGRRRRRATPDVGQGPARRRPRSRAPWARGASNGHRRRRTPRRIWAVI
jgi:hypothetical protein